MKKTNIAIVLIILCVSVVSGFGFYKQLLVNPFGWMFATCFFVCMGGLILICSMLSHACFRSPRRWLKWLSAIPGFLGLVLLMLTIVISIDIRWLYFKGLPPKPTKQEWVVDLHVLADNLKSKYPNFYNRVSEDLFKKTVADIETRISGLSDSEIVMELFRLTAMARDGHTKPIPLPSLPLHDVPLKIYRFPDGWRVIDAAPAYHTYIGNKILKIGSMSIEELVDRSQVYLSSENEFGRLDSFPIIGLVPEWLKSQGAIQNEKEVPIWMENPKGEKVLGRFSTVNLFHKLIWTLILPVKNETLPPVVNLRMDWYWFRFIEKSRTLYVQFSNIGNQSGKESIAAFSERLKCFADSHDVDRTIVDIRTNSGGDGIMSFPLVDVIRDHDKINRPSRLVVLIGRHTFSAGVLFAHKLKLQTNAVLMGEPTGQGVRFGSNPVRFTLPHSRLTFMVATVPMDRFQTAWDLESEYDTILRPDVPVAMTYQDFASGKDVVLERALQYQVPEKPSMSIPETILDKYTGRYLLNKLQVVDISRKASQLRVRIDDAIPGNLYRVQSRLWAISEADFEFDLPGISIAFPKNATGPVPGLILHWKGEQRTLARAPKDYAIGMELLISNKIEEASQFMKTHKQEYRNIEWMDYWINQIGERHMKASDTKDAIRIFTLATELFPKSFDAFCALGEAQAKIGYKEPAIQNLETALKLDPGNRSALDILEKLKK